MNNIICLFCLLWLLDKKKTLTLKNIKEVFRWFFLLNLHNKQNKWYYSYIKDKTDFGGSDHMHTFC